MKTLLFFIGLIIPTLSTSASSGPYILKFEALEQCEDSGTKDFYLTVDYDSEKDTYSGHFAKTKDLGDDTEIFIDIERMVGNEWKKEFKSSVGRSCSLIKNSPASVQSMLNAIGYKECPIPKGTDTVQGMKNSFKFPYVDTAEYGKRRGEMTFVDREGNRLGCVYMKANVVPAPE